MSDESLIPVLIDRVSSLEATVREGMVNVRNQVGEHHSTLYGEGEQNGLKGTVGKHSVYWKIMIWLGTGIGAALGTAALAKLI